MPDKYSLERSMICDCGKRMAIGEAGLVCTGCDRRIVPVAADETIDDYRKAFPQDVISRKGNRRFLRYLGGAV